MKQHETPGQTDSHGYYDHFVARQRNGFGVRVKRQLAARIVALAELPPRGVVFELGPGDGDIADIVTAKGHAYSAMDASPGIVRNLCARGYDVSQGFAPPLPAAPQHFDALFAMHVIEHMPPASAQEFLQSAAARLAPGGRIIVATPDFARWGYHFYDSDYTHINPFTARKLKQAFEAAGLRVRRELIQVGPGFGYLGVPFAWIARRLYTATVQDALRRVSASDLPGRAFLTLLPNLVQVASRD